MFDLLAIATQTDPGPIIDAIIAALIAALIAAIRGL